MSDQSEWTDAQQQHMAWLATPKSLRNPPTKSAWADQLGYNRHTLARWEKLPGFWREVRDLARDHITEDFVEVLDAIKETAKQRGERWNKHAVHLYLELIGELEDEPAKEASRPFFTADDFKRAEQEIEEWLASRPHRPSGNGTYPTVFRPPQDES